MALLSTATNVLADGVNYVMKITLSDGTVDKYFVYDRPEVFLTGDSVHVWTKVLSASYSADAVVSYTFEETATGGYHGLLLLKNIPAAYILNSIPKVKQKTFGVFYV